MKLLKNMDFKNMATGIISCPNFQKPFIKINYFPKVA